MALSIFLLLFSLLERGTLSSGVKFSSESFAEISVLVEKGKTHLESLKQKASVPHFGSCWKNAISDLQVGCKFLSENVQRDLALGFTDCFLQMSGHEPLNCDFPRSACIKKLTDRAFNAYTEFYTHTQSICYFLQSEVWHEQTEETINKLAKTSLEVSKHLEEAGKIQEELLNQQRETLVLQYDICNNSKNIVSVLQQSQDKINGLINDFKSATAEQKELLVDVFDNLALLRSWAVNELSWFNSTIYFATAALISFLFTSISRTSKARMALFILFMMNYFFERICTSSLSNSLLFGSNVIITEDTVNSWIWLCRKFCICLAVVILLYTALTYCDYNLYNYKLLLEIKKQNIKILSNFDSLAQSQNKETTNNLNEINSVHSQFNSRSKVWNNQTTFYAVKENVPVHLLNKHLQLSHLAVNSSILSSKDCVDAEQNNASNSKEDKFLHSTSGSFEVLPKESKYNYNLRSNKKKSFNF